MTATQHAESTAVATGDDFNASALPPAVVTALELKKLRNIVATKIAGLSWGKDLDMQARRALADWGQQRGVDVTTEIFILGNRIYKNADYYINRAQPYVRAGLLELSYRYVNTDKRLDERAKSSDPIVAANAEREINERAMFRIQYNVPEAAHSAVVAVVSFPKHGTSFAAAKWCGNGSRQNDPIGNSNPESTSLTRALRKALKTAVGYEPEVQIAFGEQEDEMIGSVEDVIRQSQHDTRSQLAEHRQHVLGSGTGMVSQASYGEDVEAEPVHIDAKTEAEPDPFGDVSHALDEDAATAEEPSDELPLDDRRPPRRRDAIRDGGR